MGRSKKLMALFLATIVVLTSACGTTSSAGEKDVIRVGYLPITHAAPLYFLKEYEDHYLQGRKIELIRFGSWIELMDALNTGRIDGASVLFELGMKAREKGIDLRAVALGHRDGNAVITSHDVHEPTHLIGKTVAIPHTLSAHHLLLDEMLQNGGVAYEDVDIVEMPPAEMPSALSEGRISSYIVAEPFGALGVTLDVGHVLYHSKDIRANSLCCVLVLRSDFIEQDREFANAFVKGYLEVGELAHHHDDHDHDGHVHSPNSLEISEEDVLNTHLKHLNIDEEALALSLEWISYKDLHIQKEDYDYLRKRLVEMGLSDRPPTYEEFVDQSFIEKAM